MADNDLVDSLPEFEKAIRTENNEKYVLRLYIAGMTPRSIEAIKNIKKISEEQLKGHYDLEVIDISQQPEAIKKEDIMATPTLIKKLPRPIKRLIGDLSNTEKILVTFNLIKKNENSTDKT